QWHYKKKGGDHAMLTHVLFLVRRLGQQRERGQGLAEYGLIITLIALVCVLAISAVGGSLADMYNTVAALFQ
ncbi:Flp family type IVb pilin, partial [Chloroflexus sp. MS-G]|uniref:Flp family type IVb pilin n=2 Tax=unclassified Chloroflexus TaxID=2633855 RepID=UPI001F31AE93